MGNNSAYVSIGTSKDTSEFACDSIKHWWITVGCRLYPDATSILILADGGAVIHLDILFLKKIYRSW